MDNLKTKVFTGFFWKFAERLIVQGVTFVVSLVVARILEPDDYGLIAMVTVFTNIASVIVTNGFNAALIQKDTVSDEDFSTIFFISFFLSFILYGILYITAPFIARFYNQIQLIKILRVYSLILPISSISSIQNAFIGRRMIFRKNFIASFISSVLSGFIGIVMAIKGFGVWALVIQLISNSVITCLIQFLIVPWRPKLWFSFTKSIPLLKFGANALGADLIGTIFNQLNSFVMGKWYSAAQLAYYNKGQSFPYLINNNVLNILTSVMYPAFSKRASDTKQLKKDLRKTVRLYIYVITPLYVGLIAIAKNLIAVILTEKWLPSVPFLIIVSISCLLGTIAPLDLIVLKSVGRSDIVFRLEFIKKPIWFLLLIIASFINVYAIASVLVFSIIMEIVVNGIAVNKVLNYSLKEKIEDWIITILPSVLMFIVVYAMNYIPANKIILILLQLIIGIVIYISFSLLIKDECFIFILTMLKNTLKKK